MAMHAETRAELMAIKERIDALITLDQENDSGTARSFDVIEDHARRARHKVDEIYEVLEHLDTEISVLRKELLD